MRILHTEWSDGWGGQERRIISEMRGMQARGHTLWLATREHARILVEAENAGIPTLTLPFRRAVDPTSVMRLRRQLRRLNVEIVNTHSGVDSWIGGLAARSAGTPVLLRTRHLNIPLRRGWTNFVHYLPDRIIACGEAIRTNLVDECGFPSEQVVSIPTGIDFDSFRPRRSREETRAELGLRNADLAVLMVGIIRSVKRHTVALETLRKLTQDYPNIRLLIAGDGPLRDEVETQADKLGLSSHVCFLGYRDDVADLMQAADVMLLTSRSEGVPQALTQALGLGLPVVATEVGSVPELIRHERTGLLAPAEQPEAIAAQLRRIIDDPDWARRLGAQGRTHVHTHYSLASMLDATERLCEHQLVQNQN